MTQSIKKLIRHTDMPTVISVHGHHVNCHDKNVANYIVNLEAQVHHLQSQFAFSKMSVSNMATRITGEIDDSI